MPASQAETTHPPMLGLIATRRPAAISVTPTRSMTSFALPGRRFWLVTLSLSLQSWSGGAINLHQIPHLVDRGLSAESAALVISLFAVFAAIGALFEGALDSTIGARRTLIAGLVSSALGLVILMNTSTMAMALLYALIYGLAFGLMVTSAQIIFADYFGGHSLGAIRGAAAPFQMGLNAVGPIVAGLACDVTGSYLAAFVPFTIAYLVAAGALMLAKQPARREMSPARSYGPKPRPGKSKRSGDTGLRVEPRGEDESLELEKSL